MRRSFATLLAVAVGAVVLVAPANAATTASDSASAGARRFLNCSSMRRVHPNGIAVSPAAAKLAVRNGFKRPDVRPVSYAQSPDSLDRRNRGVMCTVRS